MANIRTLINGDPSMSDNEDDIGVSHLPGGSCSGYETLCGACDTNRIYKDGKGKVTCAECLDMARTALENMTAAEIKELPKKRP